METGLILYLSEGKAVLVFKEPLLYLRMPLDLRAPSECPSVEGNTIHPRESLRGDYANDPGLPTETVGHRRMSISGLSYVPAWFALSHCMGAITEASDRRRTAGRAVDFRYFHVPSRFLLSLSVDQWFPTSFCSRNPDPFPECSTASLRETSPRKRDFFFERKKVFFQDV